MNRVMLKKGRARRRMGLTNCTIVGGNARLVNCTLSNSMIGDRVTLEQVRREVTVGDDAEVHGVS